jgi:hypothetical protein
LLGFFWYGWVIICGLVVDSHCHDFGLLEQAAHPDFDRKRRLDRSRTDAGTALLFRTEGCVVQYARASEFCPAAVMKRRDGLEF